MLRSIRFRAIDACGSSPATFELFCIDVVAIDRVPPMATLEPHDEVCCAPSTPSLVIKPTERALFQTVDAPMSCIAPSLDGGVEGAWTTGDKALRVAVALLSLGLIVIFVLAYRGLDSAPPWLRNRMLALLNGRHHTGMSSTETSLSKLLRYRIDQRLDRQPSFKLLFFAILTALLVAFGALGLYVAGEESMYSALWLALAGSGLDWTFNERAQEGTWDALVRRSVSLVVSIGGLLVTALLLSLVSDAIGNKVDELRKGKAAVLECGHTLIIG